MSETTGWQREMFLSEPATFNWSFLKKENGGKQGSEYELDFVLCTSSTGEMELHFIPELYITKPLASDEQTCTKYLSCSCYFQTLKMVEKYFRVYIIGICSVSTLNLFNWNLLEKAADFWFQ